MTSTPEICPLCGKRRQERLAGSFTQWIFDKDSCTCQKLEPALDTAPPVDFCTVCSKPVLYGRSGSLTQWLFRPDSCKCQQPQIERKSESGDTVSGANQDEGLELETFDEDIQLDQKQFPVDRYEALRTLGKGAAGTVYLCRDRLLGKKVAVKTLRSLTNQQFISFQTEARVTSKMRHPAILTLLDFGATESGSPYMVLEYFEGIPLDRFISLHGLLSLPVAVHVFSSIVSALSFAHEHGVLHRDLKPSNILIQASNELTPLVKLIDFGVAHLKREKEPVLVVGGNTIVGTPAYMSPDCARGLTYDERSEVYSLGCVFFECLTGEQLFSGETALETINQHASAPVPTLRQRGFDYSEEWEALIARCLEKQPDDRFQSMEQVSEALRALDGEALQPQLDPLPVVLPQSGKERSIRKPLLYGLGLSTLGTAITLFLVQPPAPKAVTDQISKKVTLKKPAPDPWSKEDFVSTEVSKLYTELNDSHPAEQLSRGDRYAQAGDYAEAMSSYRKAAVHNNASAKFKIAHLYHQGLGVTKSSSRALFWFREAAAAGEPNAQCTLGTIYAQGKGVPQDDAEALRWFKRSAEGGNAEGQRCLAMFLGRGRGVPKADPVEAMKWFRKSAAQGNIASISYIGQLLEHGAPGVERNYEEALKYFHRAAEASDAGAAFFLGRMYLAGQGTEKDPAEAVKWLKKSALGGYADGETLLGSLYVEGTGVENNYVQAMKLFRSAADKRQTAAQVYIGQLFERGLGVEKNYEEALKWYRNAARLGQPLAEVSLGDAYLRGHGVPCDRNEALKWYKKAAAKGNVEAQRRLNVLKTATDKNGPGKEPEPQASY